MLHKPAKGTPDYQIPLNENFTTLEDKLQYKAHCTHDPDTNLYTLSLQNIPESAAALLPAGLPDLFTVVARMPTEYTDGGKVKIGEVEYTLAYTDDTGSVSAGVWKSGAVVTLEMDGVGKKAYVGKAYKNKADKVNANFTGTLQHDGKDVWDNGNFVVESGTWTPSFVYPSTVTHTVDGANYHRIGSQILISFAITITRATTDNTGLFIKGLPFPLKTNRLPFFGSLTLSGGFAFPNGTIDSYWEMTRSTQIAMASTQSNGNIVANRMNSLNVGTRLSGTMTYLTN